MCTIQIHRGGGLGASGRYGLAGRGASDLYGEGDAGTGGGRRCSHIMMEPRRTTVSAPVQMSRSSRMGICP